MAQFLYSSCLFCLQQKPETLFQHRSYSSSQMHLSLYLEAVAQTCSAKKVFLEISQNSQENTCASLYFNKVAGLTLSKQRLWQYFPVTFAKFLRTLFLTEHLRWLLLYKIIKASINTILVTLWLILKICLSAEINFWKTPLRITFKNLRSFQDKYLWRSSILVKALSLRFAVILLTILKLMVLRKFIIILSALTGNFSGDYILINFLFSLL